MSRAIVVPRQLTWNWVGWALGRFLLRWFVTFACIPPMCLFLPVVVVSCVWVVGASWSMRVAWMLVCLHTCGRFGSLLAHPPCLAAVVIMSSPPCVPLPLLCDGSCTITGRNSPTCSCCTWCGSSWLGFVPRAPEPNVFCDSQASDVNDDGAQRPLRRSLQMGLDRGLPDEQLGSMEVGVYSRRRPISRLYRHPCVYDGDDPD